MQLWTQGIFLTVFGMGVTFLCLIALDLIIRGLDRLFREGGPREVSPSLERAPKEMRPPGKIPTEEKAPPPGGEDLMPVLAAAVAAYLEAQAVEVFRVPVKREPASRWVMDGRQTALSRRESL